MLAMAKPSVIAQLVGDFQTRRVILCVWWGNVGLSTERRRIRRAAHGMIATNAMMDQDAMENRQLIASANGAESSGGNMVDATATETYKADMKATRSGKYFLISGGRRTLLAPIPARATTLHPRNALVSEEKARRICPTPMRKTPIIRAHSSPTRRANHGAANPKTEKATGDSIPKIPTVKGVK